MEKEILVKFDAPLRSPTHPNNEKVQDFICSHTDWTKEDLDLVITCIDNYL